MEDFFLECIEDTEASIHDEENGPRLLQYRRSKGPPDPHTALASPHCLVPALVVVQIKKDHQLTGALFEADRTMTFDDRVRAIERFR